MINKQNMDFNNLKIENGMYSYMDFETAINNIFNNGLPYGIESGLNNLDETVRFDKGRLVTVTGVPQSGKSIFIDYLCTKYNILHNYKTLFYSTETPLAIHINTLMKMFQKPIDRKFVRYIYENFRIINELDDWNIDSLLECAGSQLLKFKYDIFVIDNYTTLTGSRNFNMTEHEYTNYVLDKLIKFARKYNILVILIAHPKKMQRDNINGCYDVPLAYDICGSSNFFNKSDFVITVHRVYRNLKPTNVTKIICTKCKSNNFGRVGECYLGFDEVTQNYFDCKYNNDEKFGKNENNNVDINIQKLDFEYSFDEANIELDKCDYLNIKVPFFQRINDLNPNDITLRELLFKLQGNFKSHVEKIRNESNEDKQKELKTKLLPCFCVSAKFNGDRRKENVSDYTNLMYIDIDYKDNIEIISNVPTILRSIDNILYFQKSVRGKGYSVILPIKINSISEYLDCWNQVEKIFADLNIVIDKSTKNIDRAIFISYDDGFYLNEHAIPFIYEKPYKAKEMPKLDIKIASTTQVQNSTNLSLVESYIREVDKFKLDIAKTYNDYFKLGIACLNEFGLEKSKDIFPKLCRYNKTFNLNTCIDDLEQWGNSYDESYTCNFGTIKYYFDKVKNNNM